MVVIGVAGGGVVAQLAQVGPGSNFSPLGLAPSAIILDLCPLLQHICAIGVEGGGDNYAKYL
jgi:hypothetical protein